jgi:hypothetical protein
MKQFDKLYKITAAVKDAVKKPFAYKKMKRDFESRLDALQYAQDEELSKIDDLRISVANGDSSAIDSIDRARKNIEALKLSIENITAERDLMDEKVTTDDTEEK